MTQPPQSATRAERFVEYLQQLAATEDRAALAILRRGLGRAPGEVAEAYRYVVPWLPEAPRRGEEEAYFLVAALFAWHPQRWPAETAAGSTNLGASLRWLAQRMQQRTASEPSSMPSSPAPQAGDDKQHQATADVSSNTAVERRLIALLRCHRDELPEQLRHIVGLLRAHEVPVDWARLLRDIQDWERDDRRVQRAWARAYWSAATPTGGSAAAASSELPAVAEDAEDDA